jgi:hypothetical protein
LITDAHRHLATIDRMTSLSDSDRSALYCGHGLNLFTRVPKDILQRPGCS